MTLRFCICTHTHISIDLREFTVFRGRYYKFRPIDLALIDKNKKLFFARHIGPWRPDHKFHFGTIFPTIRCQPMDIKH